MNFAPHSWPLSSEGSLACHTFCDTGHPFTIVISETRDTHTYWRAFSSGAVTTCFYDFKHPIFRLLDQRSIQRRHRRGQLALNSSLLLHVFALHILYMYTCIFISFLFGKGLLFYINIPLLMRKGKQRYILLVFYKYIVKTFAPQIKMIKPVSFQKEKQSSAFLKQGTAFSAVL